MGITSIGCHDMSRAILVLINAMNCGKRVKERIRYMTRH